MKKGHQSKDANDNQVGKEDPLQREELLSKSDEEAGEKSDGEENPKVGPVEEFIPPDGGWGWVVCFASFWTNGILFGILNSFGILYVKILQEFDDGTDDLAFRASWIGSLQISMTFFMSPIASILVDRFGIRITSLVGAILATSGMLASSFVPKIEIMYFTYGILLGVGSSLVYTPSLVILGHYFKRHLGVVNGLVAFGSAVFTIVLPFPLRIVQEALGVRNAMRIMAGLLSSLVFCSLVWRPRFEQRHSELDHYMTSTESVMNRAKGCCSFLKKFMNVNIWRNKGYVVWVIGLPVAFLGYFIPFVHLVNHTKVVLPDASGEILVMCIGATSGVSRLVTGKVADFPRVNRVRLQQAAFATLGVVTACIPFAKHFGPLVAITLIMGICDGCFICLLGPIAFDLLGPAGAAQGIGCLLGLMSIPMTAGPPLAGLVYDMMGRYDVAFWAAGAPPIIGAIILFFMPYKIQTLPAQTLADDINAMSRENLDQIGQTPEDGLWVQSVQHISSNMSINKHKIQVDLGSDWMGSNPRLLTSSHPRLAGPMVGSSDKLSKSNVKLSDSISKLADSNGRLTRSNPYLHLNGEKAQSKSENTSPSIAEKTSGASEQLTIVSKA